MRGVIERGGVDFGILERLPVSVAWIWECDFRYPDVRNTYERPGGEIPGYCCSMRHGVRRECDFRIGTIHELLD
jgi:hypothetical protein